MQTISIVTDLILSDVVKGSSRDAVRFGGVSFNYPQTKKQTLTNIEFKIKKGQTVALVGTSGTGKSIVASLFPALFEPTNDCIKVGGKDLRTPNLDDWRGPVRIVDQEVFF